MVRYRFGVNGDATGEIGNGRSVDEIIASDGSADSVRTDRLLT